MTWFTVASATVAAVSAVAQGKAQSDAAKSNAAYAERNRELSIMQAGAREDAFRRQSRHKLGSQAASMAESGVDPASGSALRTATESAVNAEIDALNIRYEGAVQAEGYANEARNERLRGRNAMQGGYFGAASSILLAAGKLYASPGGSPTAAYFGGNGLDNLKDRWGT